MLRHIAARAAALVFLAIAGTFAFSSPAMAACPYTGNSSDTPPLTDAAASLAALNEICAKTAAVPTGGATAAKQDTGNASLATIATNTTTVATSAARLCTGQIKATATACGSAAAHRVFLYDFGNAANTATSWFQIFDVAVGSVTLGTTVPSASFEIPAGGHLVVQIAIGDSFSNQITVACTTQATNAVAPTNNCSYNIVGK